MIEHSHLKIIHALHENGTLTAAANALCLSQSALSHQIRYLEKKLDIALWERNGRNLRLTQAGQLLLQTALQVLPAIEQAEKTLKAYSEGRHGILRIGVECYPCYEWLTGVLGVFMPQMPEVDVDIITKFQFSGLEGLLNYHSDILVTPDEEKNKKIHYETLADYELVLLVAENHVLTSCKTVTPDAFADETLLSFPVAVERLDIMTQFLNPALVKPARIKKITSLELMLQMVVLARGVCVLPEWLADHYCQKFALKKKRLGRKGIHKKLFIALRMSDREVPYIKKFIAIGKTAALRNVSFSK